MAIAPRIIASTVQTAITGGKEVTLPQVCSEEPIFAVSIGCCVPEELSDNCSAMNRGEEFPVMNYWAIIIQPLRGEDSLRSL